MRAPGIWGLVLAAVLGAAACSDDPGVDASAGVADSGRVDAEAFDGAGDASGGDAEVFDGAGDASGGEADAISGDADASGADAGGDAGGEDDSGVEPGDSGVVEPVDSGPPDPKDSGVAVPADSGEPDPLDSGVVGPVDSGVVGPTDSGEPDPLDSGVVGPVDSGAPDPLDSGVVGPVDSGVPGPLDTGVNGPTDSGVPDPSDSGVVGPTDSGSPDPADTGVADSGDGGVLDAGATACSLPARDAGIPATAGSVCQPLPWTDPILRISTTANQTQTTAHSTGGVISGNGLHVAYETFDPTLNLPGFAPGIAATTIGSAPNPISWIYDSHEISKPGNRVGLYENGRYFLYTTLGTGGANVFLNRFNQNAGYADEALLAPNERQIMFRTWENDLDHRADQGGHGVYVRNLDTQTNFKIPDHRLREEDSRADLYWKQNGRVLAFRSALASRAGVYNLALDAHYFLDTNVSNLLTDDLEENIASGLAATVPSDTNMVEDVYARSVHTQAVERLSLSSAGVQGNAASHDPSASDDGRFVAFVSEANNLVANDNNGLISDVLLRDRRYNLTYRLSSDAAGASGNQMSWGPRISADGRAVVFSSRASNLVAGDTNNRDDVFVAQVPRVECTPGFDGGVSPDAGNGDAGLPPVPSTALTKGTHPIAGDSASTVIFWSRESLVARDTNGHADLYAHDVAAGTNTLLSAPAAGAANGPTRSVFSASADANVVAFFSDATNLVTGDTNGRADIFILSRTTNTLTRLLGPAGVQANADSFNPSLSADGRFLAFESEATNLIAGDLNGASDVFVADLLLGTIELASVNSAGVQADGPSTAPVISGDGAVVAFDSFSSNLSTPPSAPAPGVYLRDRLAATTSADLSGAPSSKKALTFDGNVFAFQARGCCLGPSSFAWNTIVLYDRTTGTYAPDFVSFGDHSTYLGNLSADGRYLSFWSEAEDLVPGDHNHRPDIFLRDQLTGAIARLSVTPDSREATDLSAFPHLTPDGRSLVYATAAPELSGLEPGVATLILTRNPFECP